MGGEGGGSAARAEANGNATKMAALAAARGGGEGVPVADARSAAAAHGDPPIRGGPVPALPAAFEAAMVGRLVAVRDADAAGLRCKRERLLRSLGGGSAGPAAQAAADERGSSDEDGAGLSPPTPACIFAPARLGQEPSSASAKWRLSACPRPTLYRRSLASHWPREALTSPAHSATPCRRLRSAHWAESAARTPSHWANPPSVTHPPSAPSSAGPADRPRAHWPALPFVA